MVNVGLASIIFFATSAQPTELQQADVYEISAKSARCLIENEADYTKNPDDLLIIYLALCPNIKPSPQDLAKAASNTIIVNQKSSIIIIEKTRVKCFIDTIKVTKNKFPTNETIIVDARKC